MHVFDVLESYITDVFYVISISRNNVQPKTGRPLVHAMCYGALPFQTTRFLVYICVVQNLSVYISVFVQYKTIKQRQYTPARTHGM